METMMNQTQREMPVFALVSLDAWQDNQAQLQADLQAEIDAEPLDPREWGGEAPVSGFDTTCVAGRVLS